MVNNKEIIKFLIIAILFCLAFYLPFDLGGRLFNRGFGIFALPVAIIIFIVFMLMTINLAKKWYKS